MRLLIVLLLSFSSLQAISQSGYSLEFKIKGWKDTTVYLGHYYGEQTYLKDTARSTVAGAFKFDNAQTLPQGVYFLVLGKSKIFDFVVGSNQKFTIEGNSEDFFNSVSVKGDEDNRLFFENMRFNMERGKKADPFIKILKDSSLTEDQKKSARESFNKINEQVVRHQIELVEKNPTSLTARLLKGYSAYRSSSSTQKSRWYDRLNISVAVLPRTLL
jgi:hypothetical protein